MLSEELKKELRKEWWEDAFKVYYKKKQAIIDHLNEER